MSDVTQDTVRPGARVRLPRRPRPVSRSGSLDGSALGSSLLAVLLAVTLGGCGGSSAPTPARVPGMGAPLASAPSLDCAVPRTTAPTGSVAGAAGSLDEVALIWYRKGKPRHRAQRYQINLDQVPESAASRAMVAWLDAQDTVLARLDLARTADRTAWHITGVESCD